MGSFGAVDGLSLHRDARQPGVSHDGEYDSAGDSALAALDCP